KSVTIVIIIAAFHTTFIYISLYKKFLVFCFSFLELHKLIKQLIVIPVKTGIYLLILLFISGFPFPNYDRSQLPLDY
ncbi:unnamed protein product, partial [marine sediment metagenome]